MSDWIEWNGGECPVPGPVEVEYKLRIGLVSRDTARRLTWYQCGANHDIVAYRVPEHVPVSVDKDVSRQDHYTAHAIQPIEYIVANGLTFLSGNVVKYVTRYGRKGGVEDLKKARVYLDWLIEQEEIGTLTVHK